jgi:choice-of-anchor B domain-containing protein
MLRRSTANGLLGAIGFTLVALFSLSAQAGIISLVGHLDPVPGADQYADVWGEGDYAYVGGWNHTTVLIIDISDPAYPSVVSEYDPVTGTGKFRDVKVYDGVGYFPDDAGDGMHIVDLSDPLTPTLLANIRSADSGFDTIHNVSVFDGYLYEANQFSDIIKVFDVSSPASPVFVRDIVTPNAGRIHDVTALDTRLYAADITRGFTYIYDVSSIGSSAPTLLGEVPSGPATHATWVTSDGTILVVTQEREDGHVKIFDVSDPSLPIELATMDRTSLGMDDGISPHNPVIFDDTLLFISWYEAGMVAVDISDPSNPVKAGNFQTYNGHYYGYDGNWGIYPLLGLDRVLASDLRDGFYVLDATDLPEPALGTQLAVGLAFLTGIARRRKRI